MPRGTGGSGGAPRGAGPSREVQRYGPRVTAAEDVSAAIAPGESVGLVGKAASGKRIIRRPIDRKEGLSRLFVGHDREVVRRMCGRSFVPRKGCVTGPGSLSRTAADHTWRLLDAMPLSDPQPASA